MGEPASEIRLYRHRASYELDAARGIFQEAPVAHVAFVLPGDNAEIDSIKGKGRAETVMNVPLITVIMRTSGDDEEDLGEEDAVEEGEEFKGWGVYFHTHAKSGLVEAVLAGVESITASSTIIDGLVFSPTAEDHSLNYRSATLHLSHPTILLANSKEHFQEKRRSLKCVTNTVTGYARTEMVGEPGEAAVNRTTVIRCNIAAVSSKQRFGGWDSSKEPVLDAPEGEDDRGWKGVAPCWTQFGGPLGYGRDGLELKAVLDERNKKRRRLAEGSAWASESSRIEGLGVKRKAPTR